MDFTRPVRLKGVLEKRGKYTGALNTRKYQCTLQDVRFTYGREGEKVKTLDILQFQSIRPVRDCSFEIVTHSTMHVFNASSAHERDNWVSTMQELMRRNSLRPSLGFPNVKSLQTRSHSEDWTIYEMAKDVPGLRGSEKFKDMNRSFDLSPSSTYEMIPFPEYYSEESFSDSCHFNKVVEPAPTGYEEINAENPPFTYDEVKDAVDDFAPRSSSDFPKNDSSTDLYAYATTEDIRKVLLQDKPNLCNDYSSVHDSRSSAFLYSEVVVGCDKNEFRIRRSESAKNDGLLSKTSESATTETGIYHLIEEADMDIYSTVPRTCFDREDRFKEAVNIFESVKTFSEFDDNSSDIVQNRTGSSQCISSNKNYDVVCSSSSCSSACVTENQILNISDKTLAQTSTSTTNDESFCQSNIADPVTHQTHHHSVFDELRAFIGTIDSKEENEKPSRKAVGSETNAVSDLKQFLKQLE